MALHAALRAFTKGTNTPFCMSRSATLINAQTWHWNNFAEVLSEPLQLNAAVKTTSASDLVTQIKECNVTEGVKSAGGVLFTFNVIKFITVLGQI